LNVSRETFPDFLTLFPFDNDRSSTVIVDAALRKGSGKQRYTSVIGGLAAAIPDRQGARPPGAFGPAP
jgi:hypothetical protein